MTTIRQETVNRHGFTLVKDLHENERICTTCKGLGLVIHNYPYGISGERRTDGKLFPYNKPYVGQCPSCYVGVQTLCKHCGKPFPKTRLQCDCDGARAEREAEWAAKEREKAAKAKPLTFAEAEAAGIEMVYSDGLERYLTRDELSDLDDEDQENVGILWATTKRRISFDASDIIDNACEDLHEDARDNISKEAVSELQAILDGWAEKYGKYTTTYYPDYRHTVVTEPDKWWPKEEPADQTTCSTP